ncbi:tRNA (guanosine(46)-N7)-methyltransferase TrmB [Emcibacter nanhaiensis]|uniref:tRNA (guanine-N(7)-)-methyltransferase n=1 Tax=Emcibacter nanhaiensis TaxID=1505037 RepID=A0A501PMH1_9PROT|nr:tRNA (guanosine(46)-N7)-methyltransferase TrmB [Emcibacter nanhaiensis]TPD61475.1 tRNA (guanosine(46)-N7)-methyltransferase TrmB [Emcibacter nanhaiensis]
MRNLENIQSSRIYGRRHGKPLKPASQERLDRLLPDLEIILPEAEEERFHPSVFFDNAGKSNFGSYALEIGFGKGEHLAWQARANPERGFIGCEPFINGVSGLVDKVAEAGLENIRVYMDDARLLMDRLEEGCLDQAYILFPDPWPKSRHHKRRVVNDGNIRELARILKDGARLHIATDHRGYCRWILSHMLASPDFVWLDRGPGDWHERGEGWPPTRYETKALEQGRRSTYLRFERRPRKA